MTNRLVVLLVGVAGLSVAAADLAADLGIPSSETTQAAVRAVTTGSLPYQPIPKFRAGTVPQRVALVKSAFALAKSVTATPAFATAYAQAREHMKPERPADAGSLDERVTKQLAELDKSEAEMKKQMAGQPELLKQMLDGLEKARAQIKSMGSDPGMRKALEGQESAAKQQYETTLAKFDADHPADVQAAIAIRLHQFLDTCRDVDFGAALKGSGRSRSFVEPRYESKPAEWKSCYRAGREPIETARALAEAWLKDMGK